MNVFSNFQEPAANQLEIFATPLTKRLLKSVGGSIAFLLGPTGLIVISDSPPTVPYNQHRGEISRMKNPTQLIPLVIMAIKMFEIFPMNMLQGYNLNRTRRYTPTLPLRYVLVLAWLTMSSCVVGQTFDPSQVDAENLTSAEHISRLTETELTRYTAGPDRFWESNFVLLFLAAAIVGLLYWTCGWVRSGKLHSRVLMLGSVFILFVLACVLPAAQGAGTSVCTGFGDKPVGTCYGLECLLLGWFPPYTIPWSANLGLVLGSFLFACHRYRGAAICGGVATLLALTTLAFIPLGMFTQILPGYVVWQASMIGLLVFSRSVKACQLHRSAPNKIEIPILE